MRFCEMRKNIVYNCSDFVFTSEWGRFEEKGQTVNTLAVVIVYFVWKTGGKSVTQLRLTESYDKAQGTPTIQHSIQSDDFLMLDEM